MDRVFAWRQIFEVELQAHAASLVFVQDDGADAFTLGIGEVDDCFGSD
jgi:hypothetical protein